MIIVYRKTDPGFFSVGSSHGVTISCIQIMSIPQTLNIYNGKVSMNIITICITSVDLAILNIAATPGPPPIFLSRLDFVWLPNSTWWYDFVLCTYIYIDINVSQRWLGFFFIIFLGRLGDILQNHQIDLVTFPNITQSTCSLSPPKYCNPFP